MSIFLLHLNNQEPFIVELEVITDRSLFTKKFVRFWSAELFLSKN